LEKLGMVKLPPRLRGKPKVKGRALRKRRTRFTFKPIAVTSDIDLEYAKGNSAEREWNALISKHHYLGHKVVVGRCIKYLVKYKGTTAAAICFSSAAWGMQERDRILAGLGFNAERIRNNVLSNSRFLIVENGIRNLASRILSISTRQVAHDWKEFYSVAPEVVETFVQPSKFKGTCYQAANWQRIGLTKGYAKRGSGHVNSQERKEIFLYGLTPKIRRQLASVGERKRNESKP